MLQGPVDSVRAAPRRVKDVTTFHRSRIAEWQAAPIRSSACERMQAKRTITAPNTRFEHDRNRRVSFYFRTCRSIYYRALSSFSIC